MTRVYEILTYVGWSWMLIVFAIIPIRLMVLKRRRYARRGFQVIRTQGGSEAN